MQIPTDPISAAIFFINIALAGFSAQEKLKRLGDASTSIAAKAEAEGRDVTTDEQAQIDLLVGVAERLAKGE